MADKWNSEVDVCNAALLMLGDDTITSLEDEQDDKATLCNFWYANARDATLRAFPWNFAKGLATLSLFTAATEFDFSYRHQLPNDFIKARYLHDRTIRFKIVGEELHSNVDTIKLAYTKLIEDITKWDDLAVMALVLKLSTVLAYPVTKSKTTVEAQMRMYEAQLQEAKEIDSQEQTPDDLESEDLIDVRAGPEGLYYGG